MGHSTRAGRRPGRGTLATIAVVLACTVWAGGLAPGGAAIVPRSGTLPPNDPSGNIAPVPNYQSGACSTGGFDDSSTCRTATLAAIAHARSLEGLPPMVLPTNYGSLTHSQQMLVVANLERLDRGLPAISGTVATLDSASNDGATRFSDPVLPNGYPYTRWGTNFLAGQPSVLGAYYAWMYQDTYGGPNHECSTPTGMRCWIHRNDILNAYMTNPLTMGASAVTAVYQGVDLASYAELFVGDSSGATPSYTFSWATEATFVPPKPVPTGDSPTSGPAAGGTKVTITGTGLRSVTEVDFGAAGKGTNLAVNAGGTSLTVTSPPKAAPGGVQVTLQSPYPTVVAGGFTYVTSVPAAPQVAQVVSGGTTKIIVSWDAPATGGKPITGYVITPYLNGVAQTPITVPSLPTTYVVGGLVIGTPYTFTVAAVNSLGTGKESPQSVAVAPRALEPNEKFVAAAYADFLGRSPTASELKLYASGLDDATLSRGDVVKSLAASSEWTSTIVQKLYQDTLGRPGDAGGVAYWVGQIRTGALTVAEVAANFYASPEYFSGIGGGTNASWIDDLYVKVLQRPADNSGRTYWVGQVVASSRVKVALRFYNSPESCQTRVRNLFEKLLGRAPDTAGGNFWAGKVLTSGDIALAANLAASQEYFDRAQTRFT